MDQRLDVQSLHDLLTECLDILGGNVCSSAQTPRVIGRGDSLSSSRSLSWCVQMLVMVAYCAHQSLTRYGSASAKFFQNRDS